MKKIFLFIIGVLVLFAYCLSPALCEMTAEEILKKSAEQGFKDTFRLALTIQTFKGQKKQSSQALWVSGRLKGGQADFFFDFDEPKESKGLRFLLLTKPEEQPKVFMYLPATGKTLPVVTDDPSSDVGGTGLNIDDILGFVPRSGEQYAITGSEKINGQDCWVIKIVKPGAKGERQVWVQKNNFITVKSQDLDHNKKITRTYRVVEFFKTEDGKEFPREEEITNPIKHTRILVRQENAVFGIELSDKLFDPKEFGTFKWKN